VHRPAPRVGLSLMPEAAFAAACVPLFADGLVDTVEWSVDMGWSPRGTPEWLDALLDDYAEAGALDGHGVSFSLLSETPRQDRWLAELGDELRRRPYRRVSEHLGFMAAGDIWRSTPLPMPRHPDVVRHAQHQAERIAAVVGEPLGLENLGTALGMTDATEQGALCEDILAATEGWLVLDLHNLWCQAVNFRLDPALLLQTYPLSRVREVHVSGGSWWTPSGRQRRVRRDTHDGPVPDEVLALLPEVLRRCGRLDTVIVERIGVSFGDEAADREFRDSYRAIRELCGQPT
jgi:uncharacterized protein (UPF0276 family)